MRKKPTPPASSERSPHNRLRVYAATYAGNFAVILGTIACFRIAKLQFSDLDFSRYAIARRCVSFVVPILFLGLGPALTRRLASKLSQAEHFDSATALSVVLACVASGTAVFIGLLTLLGQFVASALLGTSEDIVLLWVSVPVLLGSLLHAIVVAYFRGRLWFCRSGSINAFNLGLVPVVSVSSSHDMETAFLVFGTTLTCTSLLCLVFLLRGANWQRGAQVATLAKEMLRYGIPRLPGDLALGAMLYFPIVATSYLSGIERAGEVAIAMALVGLLQSLVAPLSSILLPQATQLLRLGSTEQLGRRIYAFAGVSIAATAAPVAVVFTWAEPLLQLYLGSASEAMVISFRLVAISCIPFNLFIGLRSLVDAAYVYPINTTNILGAVATAVLVSGLTWGFLATAEAPLIGLVSGTTLLATLTILQSYRVIKDPPDSDGFLQDRPIALPKRVPAG